MTIKPETLTLKNKLKIVLINNQSFPTLTTLLLVGAGSRYETKKNNGIAHFFEHMAFKGSKKYPSALTIATLLDSIGSEHNAFTDKDHTGYWIKAPVKHFDLVIDLLSQMILEPLLKQEEIEREKGVIVEEINMYEDQPQIKVWELFEELIYPHQPLGYPITGTKETVLSFNRKTFVDYMNNLYQPQNSLLILAGNIKEVGNRRKILQLVAEKFGFWLGEKIKQAEPYENKTYQKQLIYYKKTEQAHLVLGFPSNLNYQSKEKLASQLLMIILGGGMSSRLFYQLRERRGLCYYVQSGTNFFTDTSYFYTRTGLVADVNKIKEAIKIILDQTEAIVAGRLEDKEIIKAKEMIKGRLFLDFEDSYNLALFFGKRLMFEKKIESIDQIIKKIDDLTKEELIETAKKIFQPNKKALALIGPFKEVEFIT